MKDRTPKYPGRVKLAPVAGQTNVYDMTRLDQPTQAYDPMNKNTFLKDATAALFGLGASAVPDEVLANVAEQLGERIRVVVGEYAGTGTAGVDNPSRLTAPFVPKLLIITSEGALRYVLIGIKGSPKVGNRTDSA